MHGFLHRALAPQTIACAWLVFTVALTLALAVAQSAIAAPSSMGPGIRPLLAPALVTGDALAAPASAAAPAPEPAGVPCAAFASGARAAVADRRCAAAPNVLFAPAETGRSAALARLFGTAGPHGPPVGHGIATTRAIAVSVRPLPPSITLDFSLSQALRGPFGTAVAASSAPIARAPSRPAAAAPVGAPL
jgi:hypothetical protein